MSRLLLTGKKKCPQQQLTDCSISYGEHDTITTVDITGGSPELNPNYKHFIVSAVYMGKKVMVRSNLAILTEPGMEDIPEFLAQNKVKIIASLPCYTAEGVDGQRGKGTYEKAISRIKTSK